MPLKIWAAIVAAILPAIFSVTTPATGDTVTDVVGPIFGNVDTGSGGTGGIGNFGGTGGIGNFGGTGGIGNLGGNGGIGNFGGNGGIGNFGCHNGGILGVAGADGCGIPEAPVTPPNACPTGQVMTQQLGCRFVLIGVDQSHDGAPFLYDSGTVLPPPQGCTNPCTQITVYTSTNAASPQGTTDPSLGISYIGGSINVYVGNNCTVQTISAIVNPNFTGLRWGVTCT